MRYARSGFLLLTILAVFLWVTNPALSRYSLQAVGALLAGMIISRRLVKRKTFGLIESIVTIITTILLVEKSGSIHSPVFFLHYVLLFAVSLLIEPIASVFLALALAIFYLLLYPTYAPETFLPLLGLLIFTPIAYMMGRKSGGVKKTTLFLLFGLFFLLSKTSTLAQSMKSERFELQLGNLQMAGSTATSAGFRLADVIGQDRADQFIGKGVVVDSGLNNQAAGAVLTLTVSPTILDYGVLTEKAIEKDLRITVTKEHLTSVSLFVESDGPLTSQTGETILDTVCQTKNPCNPEKGSLWSSTDIYGLGYQFEDTLFRPFASKKKGESAVLLTHRFSTTKKDEATLQTKLVPQAHQAGKHFRNTITLTLLGGL